MKKVLDILKDKNVVIGSKGASNAAITEAETELSVLFDKEYKDYLSSVGFAIYDGHELTGICKAKRLNVVDVTIRNRAIFNDVPDDWYVIEEAHIDGIVIWQDADGKVYQTAPGADSLKIADSLVDYIKL